MHLKKRNNYIVESFLNMIRYLEDKIKILESQLKLKSPNGMDINTVELKRLKTQLDQITEENSHHMAHINKLLMEKESLGQQLQNVRDQLKLQEKDNR